ncbi:MAG TPA: monofunctional biosynthetic peptidoglycan transglycosylase [Chitinophagales bacterium]|nr:monofunctional biosynthetic peptidoglycan transglycosylase [Chitinophagales bacterium]
MWKKIWRFIWKAALWFLGITVVTVMVFRFVPVPVTFLMLQRCVEQKVDGKPLKLEKKWVPLSEISNHLQLAVVTSEDQNFLWHHGFDFGAIQQAVKYNEKQQKRKHPRMRGASTISQQCAKNAFLFPSRNFIRKGLEVYFTGLIELLWPKQRIMEVYLNVIEMGPGIYGAEAASQAYFHRHAKDLTPQQAALIAGCLPEPLKLNPGNPSGYLLGRENFILSQMNLWGGRLDYNMKEFE